MMRGYVKQPLSNSVVFLLLLILLLDSNASLAEERKTLSVAYFKASDTAIYWDEKSKEVAGSLVALYRTIASELGVDIQFVGPVPFKRVILGISNGTYDMSALLSKDPEREKLMHFSAKPLAFGKNYIVSVKRLQLGKRSPIKKLQGMGPLLKSIGTEKLILPLSINMPDFVKLNAGKLNIWELALNSDDWMDQASGLIKAGRAGAVVIMNYNSAVSMASNFPQLDVIELPNARSSYIVFSKKTIEQEFVDKFNKKFSDLQLRYELNQAAWEKAVTEKEQD